MEFRFRIRGASEYVEVVNDTETDLSAQQSVSTFTDYQHRADTFIIVEKTDSYTDETDGKVHDWYRITAHNTLIDNSTPIIETEQMVGNINTEIGLRTADHELNPGEYVTQNGKMYRVTIPIPAGDTIAPNTNCIETTIINEL